MNYRNISTSGGGGGGIVPSLFAKQWCILVLALYFKNLESLIYYIMTYS